MRLARQGGRRRRCVRDRLGAARTDAGARGAATAIRSWQRWSQLAADVKSILGSATKVTYAADWSEYFGHQPQDGTGDVYFHLDPLWVVGRHRRDRHRPLLAARRLARRARTMPTRLAGARSIYDLAYLKSQHRRRRGLRLVLRERRRPRRARCARRSPTAPASRGCSAPRTSSRWWLDQHFNRPGGSEAATPTAWVPQSKPVWLMECGCPAVDKGAEPAQRVRRSQERGKRAAVFLRRPARRSRPAALPAGADRGLRSRACRRGAGAQSGLEPSMRAAWSTPRASTSTPGTRGPIPAFPDDSSAWGDGANWQLGHWLNGRVAGAPLSDVVARILDDYGFADHDAGRLEGVVAGYAIDRIMSAREALQQLELAYFFDAVESEGRDRVPASRCRGPGGDARRRRSRRDAAARARPDA